MDDFEHVENVTTETKTKNDMPILIQDDAKKKMAQQQQPAFAFSVNNCWHAFDKIVCVHFDDNPKRRTRAEKFFAKHDIPAEFLTLQKHEQGDVRGRFEGHMLAMRNALKDETVQNILIFDDNPHLLNLPTAPIVAEVCGFVRQNNFHTIALDASPAIFFNQARPLFKVPHVFQVGAQSAGAYVASRKFMERMVKMDFELLHASLADIYAMDTMAYSVLPAWFCDAGEPSEPWGPEHFRTVLRQGLTQVRGRYAARSPVPASVIFAVIAILIVLLLLCLLMDKK